MHNPELRLKSSSRQDRSATTKVCARTTDKGFPNGRIYSLLSRNNKMKRELTLRVPDKDCPTRMFFLPAEVLKMYVLSEMEFADETGSMYIAQTDVDQFEVRIRHFVNLFNEQPAACGVLSTYISP